MKLISLCIAKPARGHRGALTVRSGSLPRETGDATGWVCTGRSNGHHRAHARSQLDFEVGATGGGREQT